MKIIEKIKKHDNLLVLLAISLIVLAIMFCLTIDIGDELWTFSNIYKMSNGYTIYKDLNVIQTPLFFYVGEILFKIFGANYLVYRIYQSLIHICMWFIVYQLFKALKIRKLNSVVYLLGIMLVYHVNMLGTGSYNTFAIMFYILGVLLLVKEKYKPNTNRILQGIIIFLIFLSKQNVAVFYIIADIIYKIVTKRKQAIKELSIELLTSFVLLLLFLFALYLKGNLYDFINYAVLGISEFAEKNTAIMLLYIVGIQIFLLAIYIIIASIKKIPFEDEDRKNIKLLSIFSMMIIFFAYPIFNDYHIYMQALLTIITTIYIIDKLIFEELLKSRVVDVLKKLIIVGIMLYFMYLFVTNNVNYITNIYKEGPYFGSIMKPETEQEIDEVVSYIKDQNNKGYEVKILSCYSNLYMNVLNKNNGVMDLIFNGNMGKDGPDGVIRQIENSKNTKFLITKEEDKRFQESKKIIEYVKNNLNETGEINRFLIFE